MLQYLSLAHADKVWKSFGSWIRTIRPGVLPSEQVVAVAMRNVMPEFLAVSDQEQIFAQFIRACTKSGKSCVRDDFWSIPSTTIRFFLLLAFFLCKLCVKLHISLGGTN
jgi:hypothetical protein